MVITGKSFSCCDFRGATGDNSKVVFKKCIFFQCDFAQSDLSDIKFSDCKFRESSFTLCDFGNARLLRCSWKDIALSGTETDLHNAYITNPKEFLNATYNAMEGLDEVYPFYRVSDSKRRFYGTKATVARDLLSGLKKNGSEGEFYQAVAVHEMAQGKSRIMSLAHKGRYIKALFNVFQLLLIVSFAQLNSWGKNPMKPLMIYLIFGLIFTGIYFRTGMAETIPRSFEKSFNVSVFSGYNYEIDKHGEMGIERVFLALQLFTSLVLYTSFVATLIGRLSRIK